MFLKELLLQPQHYGRFIRWIDKEKGKIYIHFERITLGNHELYKVKHELNIIELELNQ